MDVTLITADETPRPPEGAQIGNVEIPWQANVYVLIEDGGSVQIRHGVDDQRQDPIRLERYEATELAYLLLWAVCGKGWTIPSVLPSRLLAPSH